LGYPYYFFGKEVGEWGSGVWGSGEVGSGEWGEGEKKGENSHLITDD